ncbi:MAG: hypothetical protein AAES65_16135 [Candidatus Thiodiazotropha sp. (ex. Lucinoma kazani)]
MSPYIKIITIFIAATMPALVYASPAKGEGSKTVTCPNEILYQLHTNWHALASENNQEKRERMVSEHRQLIIQAQKMQNEIVNTGIGKTCSRDSNGQYNDLVNMVKIHRMMIEMIEK